MEKGANNKWGVREYRGGGDQEDCQCQVRSCITSTSLLFVNAHGLKAALFWQCLIVISNYSLLFIISVDYILSPDN